MDNHGRFEHPPFMLATEAMYPGDDLTIFGWWGGGEQMAGHI